MISVWAVYDKPTDYPDRFVARRYQIAEGETTATEDVMISTDIEIIHHFMQKLNLFRTEPFENDDKKIIEVWL